MPSVVSEGSPIAGFWLISWADYIFVMEKQHANQVEEKHRSAMKGKRIRILNIPDEYEYMDSILIQSLQEKLKDFFDHASPKKP
jgi:predicted protein tyrosine phosphatase